jgi:hypothetical protein
VSRLLARYASCSADSSLLLTATERAAVVMAAARSPRACCVPARAPGLTVPTQKLLLEGTCGAACAGRQGAQRHGSGVGSQRQGASGQPAGCGRGGSILHHRHMQASLRCIPARGAHLGQSRDRERLLVHGDTGQAAASRALWRAASWRKAVHEKSVLAGARTRDGSGGTARGADGGWKQEQEHVHVSSPHQISRPRDAASLTALPAAVAHVLLKRMA